MDASFKPRLLDPEAKSKLSDLLQQANLHVPLRSQIDKARCYS